MKRFLPILFFLLAVPPLAAEESVPEGLPEIKLTFAPVVRQVAPAVVNVYTAAMVSASPFDDPVLRELFGDSFGPGFGGGGERQATSLGSGVIVAADGLVVTNEHVIRGAEQVTVVLADSREFLAEIVLTDERTDLAVLRIDPKGEALPAVEFHDSDALQVGDLVLAIGNPFAVGQTVTLGIVSALARTQVGVSDYSFFIQTDAAINPGNSGGALVTVDGRLVGINTAIYSRSGGSIGIGFAIPANMVRTVISAAVSGMPVQRPWPGLKGEAVTAELAPSLGLAKPGGIVVASLYPDGPAARAGLAPGDVILEVQGQPVLDVKALNFRLATLGVGGTAELSVLSRGARTTLALPLETAPDVPPTDPRLLEGRQPLAGATVANLSPALSADLGLSDLWEGVIVVEVQRGTPARRFGFRPGDLVLSLNGEGIETTEELETLLLEPLPLWYFEIERDGRRTSVEVAS